MTTNPPSTIPRFPAIRLTPSEIELNRVADEGKLAYRNREPELPAKYVGNKRLTEAWTGGWAYAAQTYQYNHHAR